MIFFKKSRLQKSAVLIMLFFMILFGLTLELKADINPMQFVFIARQMFPEVKEINFFLSETDYSTYQNQIERAAGQFQFRPVIFLVNNPAEIGNHIRTLKRQSILVLFPSELIDRRSSQLFILRECKNSQIFLFTASEEYTEMGGLLGIVQKNGSLEILLNLEQYGEISKDFTEDKIAQLGISKVIQ